MRVEKGRDTEKQNKKTSAYCDDFQRKLYGEPFSEHWVRREEI